MLTDFTAKIAECGKYLLSIEDYRIISLCKRLHAVASPEYGTQVGLYFLILYICGTLLINGNYETHELLYFLFLHCLCHPGMQ